MTVPREFSPGTDIRFHTCLLITTIFTRYLEHVRSLGEKQESPQQTNHETKFILLTFRAHSSSLIFLPSFADVREASPQSRMACSSLVSERRDSGHQAFVHHCTSEVIMNKFMKITSIPPWLYWQGKACGGVYFHFMFRLRYTCKVATVIIILTNEQVKQIEAKRNWNFPTCQCHSTLISH